MTLKEKLDKWAALKNEMDSLEQTIKTEIIALEQSVLTETVNAKYSKGRGAYDYEAIVKRLDPPTPIIELFTKKIVDYKGIADKLNASEQLRKQFYSAGTPSCSISLLKG